MSGWRFQRPRMMSHHKNSGSRKDVRNGPNSDTPFEGYVTPVFIMFPSDTSKFAKHHFCASVWQAIGPSQISWCPFRDPWVSEIAQVTDFVQASETINYCTSRLLFSLQISARVARFPHFRFGLPVIALHNRKLHSLHGAMAHIYWMVNGWLMDGIYGIYVL